MVLGDRIHVLHDSLNHAGWNNDATLVVEKDVVFSFAVVGSSDLAHRVKGSGYVGYMPSAADGAVLTFNVGDTLAIFFNDRKSVCVTCWASR